MKSNFIVKAASAAAILLAVVGAVPTTAFAHAHLLTSTPAKGDVVPAPDALKLTFSEGVEMGLSKIELADPQGQAIADVSAALDPASNKVVLVRLKTPLSAGIYTVHWHVVSVDTHRTEGTYSFTVKP